MSNYRNRVPICICETTWPENATPLVSIQCITYNHENYIRDAIEGFLMQKTTFPVEILIHDDASTDNTAHIIREYEARYPQLIKPIYQKENQYSKRKGLITKIQNERSKGKYIAKCEGDDYWIDPLKLQKQYDFLNNNPDYGLVATDFSIYNQATGKIKESVFKYQPRKFPVYTDFEDFLINAGYMAPCTWFFRAEHRTIHINKSASDGTFIFFLNILWNSKIFVLNDTTTVYRELPESASHIKSIEGRYKRELGILNTQLFYIKKYNLHDSLKENVLSRHYKKVLPSLIVLGYQREIQDAKKYIAPQEINLREFVLFKFANFRWGVRTLKLLYRYKDSLNWRL